MERKKALLEVGIFTCFLFLFVIGMNRLPLPFPDGFLLLFGCVIEVGAVCFWVKKIDGESLQAVGLIPPVLSDLFGGIALGALLYLLQILPPVFFFHLDISQAGNTVDFPALIGSFLFLTITVGLPEELVFRGFLLHKSRQIFISVPLCISINCLLFSAVHLPKTLTLDWTQLYSAFLTSILLCCARLGSKRKSIYPMIIAHGLLDALIGGAGFAVWNFLFG